MLFFVPGPMLFLRDFLDHAPGSMLIWRFPQVTKQPINAVHVRNVHFQRMMLG